MVKTFFKTVVLFYVFLFLPCFASAAILSVDPSNGIYEVGDRIIVKIIATSNDIQFNAVSSSILFPSSIFEIESISKTNSVLDFWVTEPVFSKNFNTVKFEGISLGGFKGFTGTVITIALRAIKVGSGEVTFQNGHILANDGQGTDITGNLTGASFIVKEALPESLPSTIKKEKITVESITTPIIQSEVFSQPVPTLNVPEIILGKKYESLVVLGTSDYPKTQTLITFIAQDGTKVFILGTSDDDGSFNILVPKSLKSGVYSVSARMIKEDKTNSEESNMVTLQIGNIFSDISWQLWFVISFLIFFILYLLIRLYSHFDSNKSFNKYKLHEVEDVVHKSFDILREDIVQYDREKYTSIEHKRIVSIKKDINDAEKVINKEIKNVE